MLEWLPLYHRTRSMPSTRKVTTVINTAQQIVDLDQNREALALFVTGSASNTDDTLSLYWSQKDATDTNSGWQLYWMAGGPLVLSKLLHGGIVTYPIWCYSTQVWDIYVVESSYHVCQADEAEYLKQLKAALTRI